MALQGIMVAYPEGIAVGRGVKGLISMYQGWLKDDDEDSLKALHRNYQILFEGNYETFKHRLTKFCALRVVDQIQQVLNLEHPDKDSYEALTLRNKEVVLYAEDGPASLLRQAIAFDIAPVLNIRSNYA